MPPKQNVLYMDEHKLQVSSRKQKHFSVIQVAIPKYFGNSHAIQLKCRSAFLSDLFRLVQQGNKVSSINFIYSYFVKSNLILRLFCHQF